MVLTHPAQAAPDSQSESRSFSPSQLSLWPLLASVGSEDLAIAVVSGTGEMKRVVVHMFLYFGPKQIGLGFVPATSLIVYL